MSAGKLLFLEEMVLLCIGRGALSVAGVMPRLRG